MKVLLALVMCVSFSAMAAGESPKVGEVSSQAIDCEKILANQGAKPVPQSDTTSGTEKPAQGISK